MTKLQHRQEASVSGRAFDAALVSICQPLNLTAYPVFGWSNETKRIARSSP